MSLLVLTTGCWEIPPEQLTQITVSASGSATVGDPTVTITASPATTVNQNEVLVLTASSSVSATISLSATPGDVSPGGSVTYAWQQLAGPTATIASATAQNTTASTTQSGAYTFRVTATDTNGTTASDDVNVSVTGLSIGSISWTQTSGTSLASPFSTPSDSSTNFSTATPGTFGVQATVTTEAGTSGSDQETLTITATPDGSITVDAGAPQTFVFGISALAGGVPGAGVQITADEDYVIQLAGAGLLAGQIADELTATATDLKFTDAEISYQWEVVSVPSPAATADLSFIDSTAGSTGFSVTPQAGNNSTQIRVRGDLANLANVCIFGQYTFRVTATNPDNNSDSDEVTWTLVPPFVMGQVPAGASFHGAALQTGELTHRVLGVNNTITVPFTVLSKVAGTLTVELMDDGDQTTPNPGAGAWVAAAAPGFTDYVNPATLATETLVADNDNTATVSVSVTSADGGTFDIMGTLASGAASVARAPLGFWTAAGPPPVPGVGIHVQPALSGTVDVRAQPGTLTTRHFGVVNSTSDTMPAAGVAGPIMYHGVRTAAVTAWESQAIAVGDLNNDGWDEVLAGGNTAQTDLVAILSGLPNDPTQAANSPVNNNFNNDGQLTLATGVIDTFRVQTVAGAAPATGIHTLALGDIDNSGYLDLIVGLPGYDAAGANSAEGLVLIFYNRDSATLYGNNPFNGAGAGALLAGAGLPAIGSWTPLTGAAGDQDLLGFALASGEDVTGDNIDDIVIGAPGADPDDAGGGVATGAIYGIAGQDGGTKYVGAVTIGAAAAGANAANTTFNIQPAIAAQIVVNSFVGASLDLANLNGAGCADILWGAPGATDSSALTLAGIIGINAGPLAGGVTGAPTVYYEGDAANLALGRQVAAGDVDGNGTMDVIASASANTAATLLEANSLGRLYIIPNYHSSIQTAVAVSPNRLQDQPLLTGTGGAGTGDNLASRIAVGNYNGDTYDDILVLRPSNAAANANEAILYFEGSAGITALATLSATATFNNAVAGGAAILNLPVATTAAPIAGTVAGLASTGTAVLYTGDGWAAFADYNGDQVTDIMWRGVNAGAFSCMGIAGAE